MSVVTSTIMMTSSAPKQTARISTTNETNTFFTNLQINMQCCMLISVHVSTDQNGLKCQSSVLNSFFMHMSAKESGCDRKPNDWL